MEAAEGGCILIEGDAGMGKSRLMEEIQRSNLGGNRDAITMLFSSADFDHRGQVAALLNSFDCLAEALRIVSTMPMVTGP